MKFNDTERDLIRLLENCGGSYCGNAGDVITPAVKRAAKSLERKGVLIIEPTDEADRYTLRETVHA